jgi:tRNA1(Val) A37 N6-methylase TrmN6
MRTTEQLGSFTLFQEDGLPKISRDSLLLSRFATLKAGYRVFDLGCGIGVLGICLAQREQTLVLDGMDLQEDCVALCRENLAANGLLGTIWQGDAASPPKLPWGSYDLVIANPPYFRQNAGKTAQGSRGIARTAPEGLKPWCETAARLLKNGGRFALCCRPEGMNRLFAHLTDSHLEPKRLQPVQSSGEKNANLILLEAVRQGRPGLTLLPALIAR